MRKQCGLGYCVVTLAVRHTILYIAEVGATRMIARASARHLSMIRESVFAYIGWGFHSSLDALQEYSNEF